MRRITAIAATVAIIGGLMSASLPAAASGGGPPAVPGQVIVAYKDAPDVPLRRVRRDHGLSLLRRVPNLGIEVARVPEGSSVEHTIAALNDDPSVAYAEPNYVYEAAGVTPDDPAYPQQWALDETAIAASRAWTLTTGVPSVRIAVVDTGVDLGHQDLAPNLWTNPGEIPGNLIDDEGNGYVDDVHGYDFAAFDSDPADAQGHDTHVAGIAAARGDDGVGVAGVNWDASIVALRALDDKGFGTTLELAQAFRYAGSMGFRIVNASLGGTGYSITLHKAIQDHPGTLFVVSAGNGGADGIGDDNLETPSYPCDLPEANVLCVTATDRDDALTSFANYGAATVDLAAPGVDILSTLTGNGYAFASGTSMAAPFVSGTAALLWSVAPQAGVAEVKDAIMSSVDAHPSLSGTTVSGGRLNSYRALLHLVPDLTPVEEPAPEPEPEPDPDPSVTPDQDAPDKLDSGVSVRKRSRRVVVRGWVAPPQRGAATVRVVLKERRGGRFRTVARSLPLLSERDDQSTYTTRFARRDRHRCRVVARFVDADKRVTKASRTFSC